MIKVHRITKFLLFRNVLDYQARTVKSLNDENFGKTNKKGVIGHEKQC